MVDIVVEDLSFSYPSVEALKNMSFDLESGFFVGVVGPNGAGKSTLLKCLAGILTPQRGVVMIDGRNLRAISADELSRLVSIVLTNPVETQQMRVFDVLATGRHPYTGYLGFLTERDIEAVEKAAEVLQVGKFVPRRFMELSDGQRQRVVMARALVQEPHILLLDEPTAHLDIRSQIEVLELVKHLAAKRGVTVIATFHDLTIASLFSDSIILMKDGTIMGVGAPEAVLTEEAVCEAYSLPSVVAFDLLGRYIIPRREGAGGLRVHVIAGGGTGPPVFRALIQLDVALTAGVLHEAELDYLAARASCVEVVAIKPHTPITEESLARARSLVERADIVVDTGFPVSSLNEANLRLISEAAEGGKRVLSLRSWGPLPEAIERVANPFQLTKLLGAVRK